MILMVAHSGFICGLSKFDVPPCLQSF